MTHYFGFFILELISIKLLLGAHAMKIINNALVALSVLSGAMAITTSASAAIVLADTGCSLSSGCLFNLTTQNDNITESAASVQALETAYNTQHIEPPFPATIDLQGLFKTPGSLSATSGIFTLPGGGLFDFCDQSGQSVHALPGKSDQFGRLDHRRTLK
ncbi:hypothetical protein ACF1BQ_025915 [Bradyrhizobium sp. RDT10]